MKIETRFDLNDSVAFYPQGDLSTKFGFNTGVQSLGRIAGFKITEAGTFYLILDTYSLKVVEVNENDVPDSLVADVAKSLGKPEFPEVDINKLVDAVKKGERSLS
jgi:hypothetical protein